MKIIAFVAAICAITLVFAGYSVKTEDEITIFSETRSFGNGHNKLVNKITTTPESVFAIEIFSNPTTGYMWKQIKPEKMKCLATNDTKGEGYFVLPTVPKGKVGVPGKQRFFFTPIQEGHETLSFEYKRPWQNTSLLLYKVHVTIK